ncbi:unnamed protein product [Anisakis simplex]|uniref:Kinesin motor domain-containing protein n=1 Tax=Anisakis simplex TaxID=6269 RepID=A0A0M3JF48_ANISI|nr:unnamed protein product [Anisakis simplex]
MDTSQHRMLVVVDTPQAQNKNRSSVCFHVLRDDVILGQESAVSALSTTVNDDSKLSRLYQAFKVANIEVGNRFFVFVLFFERHDIISC